MKLAAVATLALCCSLPALAHAQMGSMNMGNSAGSLADTLNKQLAGEEKEIEGLVDAMPADKFSFAPTGGDFKGVRNFGDQAKHLIEANYGFFNGFGVSGGKTRAQIDSLTSKADLEQALKDSFAYAHQAIATINMGNAFTPMGGTEGGSRAGTAVSMLAHAMDHYGQMVVYLRMNGIVPPASRKAGM